MDSVEPQRCVQGPVHSDLSGLLPRLGSLVEGRRTKGQETWGSPGIQTDRIRQVSRLSDGHFPEATPCAEGTPGDGGSSMPQPPAEPSDRRGQPKGGTGTRDSSHSCRRCLALPLAAPQETPTTLSARSPRSAPQRACRPTGPTPQTQGGPNLATQTP